MKKYLVAIFCIVLLLSGAVAMAQTITGSVRGTVTDPSGAVVAGAKVAVTNVGTGVTKHTVTDKSGLYDVEFLVIGDYTVAATAPGFETASVGPFHVQIDQIVTADAKLQVGKTSVTVNVSADQSLLLNTENSTISTSISASTLESMPLGGQNVQIATLFVPGANNPNASYMSGQMGTERDAYNGYNEAADAQPSFNGNRQQANSYILDGIDINETINNSLGYNPSPYSIEEMHVITGNADAEFGNVNGGEVVMVTKGGANQFHGTGFEVHEASGLEANSWSNKNRAVALARTPFTQNQFGVAVGGPIFKNKLFFFGNYIGMRNTQPGGQSAYSVPTSAERGLSPTLACPAGNADLSGVLSIDGVQLYNTQSGLGVSGNGTPYPNNCIPIVNPAAKYLFQASSESVLPLPNTAPISGTYTSGNYVGTSSKTEQNNQGDIRLDYTVNSKDTLMVKYSKGDAWDLTNPGLPVVFPYGDDYPFTSAAIAWTHVVSPTIVNNARAGFARMILTEQVAFDPSGVFGNHGDATLGINLPNQATAGFTYMNTGTSDLNNMGSQVFPATGVDQDNNFNYSDTLTWEHGKHITKFGADFVRYEQDYFQPGNLGGLLGIFSYSGNYTSGGSYGYSDFITDQATNVQIAGVTGLFGMRQWRSAAFVQDDWKILPNLTINMGLRYSYEQPNYEVNNKMVNVNLPLAYHAAPGTPLSTMLEYAGQYNPATGKVNSRALINPYYLGFMPRFGFAYKVTPKMVVRGGYGSTDEMESTGTGLRMTQNQPFQPSFVGNGISPTTNSGGTWFTSANGFSSISSGSSSTVVPGAQYDSWDPNMRPAVIQQFSLNVQYQIDNHTSVQAGYVGNLGQHLAVPLFINQYTEDVPSGCDAACYASISPYDALVGDPLNGGSGNLIETASRAITNYHSLQATLQRHQSNGLEFLVNYTYGKNLTNNPGYYDIDGGSTADSYAQDVTNPRGNYGPSAFDVRQMVSANGVYELPLGRGKQFGANWNRIVDEVLGGWKVAGNIQLNTGYALTIHDNGSCSRNCAETQLYDAFAFANHYQPLKVVGRGMNAAGLFSWFGTDPSALPCTSYYNSADGTGTSPNQSTCAYGRAHDWGDTHVGTERGPGFQNYDFSLFKSFQTYKDEKLKARIDAYNAFNVASYGNPGNYIYGGAYNGGNNAANYGIIHGTRSNPRQLALSLIYSF